MQDKKSKKALMVVLSVLASITVIVGAVFLFVYISPLKLIKMVSDSEIINSVDTSDDHNKSDDFDEAASSDDNNADVNDSDDDYYSSINSNSITSAVFEYDYGHAEYDGVYDHDSPIIESEILIDFSIPMSVDWNIPMDLVPEYDYYTSSEIGNFYWVMRDAYDRYSNEYCSQQWSARSEFPDEDRIMIRSYKDDVILEVEYIKGEINYYSYIILSSTSDFAVEAFYNSEGELQQYNVNNYTYYDWGRCERCRSYNAAGELIYSMIYHSDPYYEELEEF